MIYVSTTTEYVRWLLEIAFFTEHYQTFFLFSFSQLSRHIKDSKCHSTAIEMEKSKDDRDVELLEVTQGLYSHSKNNIPDFSVKSIFLPLIFLGQNIVLLLTSAVNLVFSP